MKFSEKLSSHLTPEWRQQYIAYMFLKNMIISGSESLPSAEENNGQQRAMFLNDFEESFFKECDNELIKINNFYAEKLAEAMRRYNLMIMSVRQFSKQKAKTNRSFIDLRPELPKQTTNKLKLAFTELYLSFVLLQNYQSLNYTGFRKILKKHDKLLNTKTGEEWFMRKVEVAPFNTNHEILRLIKDSEDFFTLYLEGGDRAQAMKRLRVPPLAEVQLPWTTFRVGLFLGISLALSVVVYFSSLHEPLANTYLCLHLYRGPMLLTLFLFLISLNINVWRATGVNHILIFEIDPRRHLRASDIMEIAAFIWVLWLLSILGFIYHTYLHVPPMVFPLLLIAVLLAFLFNPINIFHRNTRWWFIKLMGRILSAPFHAVGFADFWMADQLNSLTTTLVDFKFFCCIYIVGVNWQHPVDINICSDRDFIVQPIVRCFPAWIRLAQCMRRFHDTGQIHPYLVNAIKYTTTFPVAFFATKMAMHKNEYVNNFDNPYVWGYLVTLTISTFYGFAWDMLRDFGVFKKFQGENIFLREQIIYPALFYYVSIVEDFVLRFIWIIFFYIKHNELLNDHISETIAAVLEVFRRFIWNFFRLEHEHLYNVGEFRAVRDISVPILDPEDQMTIQRMMDEFDGVHNRKTFVFDY